jgi:hypothetical protein
MNNRKMNTSTSQPGRDREKKKPRRTAWANDGIPQEILVPGIDFVDTEEKDDENEFNEYHEKITKVPSLELIENGDKGDDELGDAMDILESKQIQADEEFKKRDLSLLVAIELVDTPIVRWIFGIVVMGTLALCFLYESSTLADYTMRQNILVYGEYNGEVAIKSGGILIFALFLDAKEIYQTIRSVIPFYGNWIPEVTIDTTADVNALFIGNKIVSLLDVTEAHTFSPPFVVFNMIGYLLGCFPWAIFSMIIRNQYLPFDIMRITSPIIGTIVMIRAILGPAFLIKSSYALYAVFNLTLKGREDLGLAFKATRTQTSAINMAIFLACGCALLLSIVALKIASLAFGVFLFLGFFYGAITGCSHSLPIRPWMTITTIADGVWLRLKEKRRCPCIYWCGYCSDMHDAEEVFVVFPRDQVKFLSKIKGNTETNNV